MTIKRGLTAATWGLALATLLIPALTQACACGCGVFAVGADALMAPDGGGRISIEYDFMDQDRNRSGQSSSDANNNPDKEIRTHFITFGGQYVISQNWTVTVDVPIWDRTFRTENDDGTGVDQFNHTAVGDVRVSGIYTGLLSDRSLGLTLGLKLPTGDWTYSGFDRDTEIGTGTTDVLLGVYKRGTLGADRLWTGFASVLADIPVDGRAGYQPGIDVNAALGLAYGGLSPAGSKVTVVPLIQVIASARARDTGPAADPEGSGYERLLLSPGVAVEAGKWRLQGDVGFPIYQRVRGQQLTAPALLKVRISRAF